ncbi:MAG TPA: exodeoxyribonuclease VII large subunit, partial [Parvularculaceae bacterium]|nr:exodeoxyribonuclease VII large subunit [Parvularculaceae bacterium]
VVERANARLDAAAKLLGALSYENVLERGFVLVRSRDGAIVRRAAETKAGQSVSLRFSDGERGAVIDGDALAGKKSKPAAKKSPTKQKSLFD